MTFFLHFHNMFCLTILHVAPTQNCARLWQTAAAKTRLIRTISQTSLDIQFVHTRHSKFIDKREPMCHKSVMLPAWLGLIITEGVSIAIFLRPRPPTRLQPISAYFPTPKLASSSNFSQLPTILTSISPYPPIQIPLVLITFQACQLSVFANPPTHTPCPALLVRSLSALSITHTHTLTNLSPASRSSLQKPVHCLQLYSWPEKQTSLISLATRTCSLFEPLCEHTPSHLASASRCSNTHTILVTTQPRTHRPDSCCWLTSSAPSLVLFVSLLNPSSLLLNALPRQVSPLSQWRWWCRMLRIQWL